MYLCELGHLDYFQIGGFGLAELDIVLYSIGEEERILWNNRDRLAQVVEVE